MVPEYFLSLSHSSRPSLPSCLCPLPCHKSPWHGYCYLVCDHSLVLGTWSPRLGLELIVVLWLGTYWPVTETLVLLEIVKIHLRGDSSTKLWECGQFSESTCDSRRQKQGGPLLHFSPTDCTRAELLGLGTFSAAPFLSPRTGSFPLCSLISCWCTGNNPFLFYYNAVNMNIWIV